MRRRWAWAVAALLLAGAPDGAHAQLFLAARPHPEFTIGPLFVRASVAPKLGPVTVDIFWSLVVPPNRSSNLADDLFLLWPGGVIADPAAGAPDPALARYVEARGFTVVDRGRLPLFARSLYQIGRRTPPEPVPGGAPFVSFVRQGDALGNASPATYVRIPWTPKLVNRAWLMDLRLTTGELIRPRRASWLERSFWGQRHVIMLGFNEVRHRGVFPMYFEHRDRVVRLSEDPSQLLVSFAEADRLKIDELSPPTASRRLSETRERTEVVSVFLDRSEGITPQVLKVQFGYFGSLQTWTPILISMLFFVLGGASGPLIQLLVRRLGARLAARVHVGRQTGEAPGRQKGVVLSRDTLARVVPGVTTYEELMRLCGPEVEEHEQLATPERRTLIYRGSRVVPQRRRTFGWLATVSHWAVEHHEVEIALERDRVVDVQARVRRFRLATPEPA